MSTLWVGKDTLALLKEVSVVLGARSLGDTVGRLIDHFRTCPRGLNPILKDMGKRMEALKTVRRPE